MRTGGYGESGHASGDHEHGRVISGDAEEASMVLAAADSASIVPSYGLAVARAQQAVHEVARALVAHGAQVRFDIHPVAVRMPGHTNVGLAEAELPHELLLEMGQIDAHFAGAGRPGRAIVTGGYESPVPVRRRAGSTGAKGPTP